MIPIQIVVLKNTGFWFVIVLDKMQQLIEEDLAARFSGLKTSTINYTHTHSMPTRHLRALSTDAASQLDVLWHDGDTLGVDGSQVGVLEETNQVSLSGLLEGKDG